MAGESAFTPPVTGTRELIEEQACLTDGTKKILRMLLAEQFPGRNR